MYKWVWVWVWVYRHYGDVGGKGTGAGQRAENWIEWDHLCWNTPTDPPAW